VHSHCYRSDEILMLIRVANEMGFKIRTFQHVLEGYKVGREIAAHGAGAGTFIDWWGFKAEANDATPYNVALMSRDGVLVSTNSDSDELARRLNLDAAKAMKYGGLSHDDATKLITINPARQLGIAHRTGSIEVGKDADLAIWTGDPLSTFSRVETTFVDGEIVFDRTRDIAMRAELAREKAERLRTEAAESKKKSDTKKEGAR
jgi:imidazolonepropionase-like amidohydrolase